MTGNPSSIYIHIPFCARKCLYCDFASYPGMESLFGPYVEALKAEIRLGAERFPGAEISTIYFGGGTPNLLSAEQLGDILGQVKAVFTVSPDAEISTEANPGVAERGVSQTDLTPTISAGGEGAAGLRPVGCGVEPPHSKRCQATALQIGNSHTPTHPHSQTSFACIRRVGFNRLSLGVQSLNDDELQALGRVHTAEEAVCGFRDAREAGFDNISLDLMYGIPRQTMESWRRTLDGVLALGPEHISLYSLTVEEGTPFYKMQVEGRLTLPGSDIEADMYEEAISVLSKSGFEHYEISNFARPGFRCRHNLTYWHNEPYFGFGSGATSYLNGVRATNTADVREYVSSINAGRIPVSAQEKLTGRESMGETMFLGLRLLDGVNIDSFTRRYGISPQDAFPSQITDLISRSMIEEREGFIRLTKSGLLFANDVFCEFVGL